MKKVTVFILTFILFIPIVNGKNINDLYGELNALENQKNLYSYLNSEDIKSLSNNGLDIQIIIDSLNDEINELDKEITSKEEFINSLKEEIDNVMVIRNKGIIKIHTRKDIHICIDGTCAKLGTFDCL